MDLRAVYLAALERCDPAALAHAAAAGRGALGHRPAIAIGKCALSMAAGLARSGWRGRGLAIVPAGYEPAAGLPGFEVLLGSHPDIDDRSFRAGERLLDFARGLREPALVLLSGGASAAAEFPLAPHVSLEEIAAINRELVRAGLAIEAINVVRKHLSAIKGGRLATALPPGSETWIVSDVHPGREEMVGSGPTLADRSTAGDAALTLDRLASPLAAALASRLRAGLVPETPKRIEAHPTRVLADNRTLVRAAAERVPSGHRVVTIDEQIEGDVEDAAAALAAAVETLEPGEVAVAGGEPTVRVLGAGKGGRCSELALRLVRRAAARGLPPFDALIASSDGRDGNSGAAGYVFTWDGGEGAPAGAIDAALRLSDAHPLAARLGREIRLDPTGNNLRDIMMMARR
jgi:hydroxypyruvate reductase